MRLKKCLLIFVLLLSSVFVFDSCYNEILARGGSRGGSFGRSSGSSSWGRSSRSSSKSSSWGKSSKSTSGKSKSWGSKKSTSTSKSTSSRRAVMKKRQVTRERNRVAATKSYATKTNPTQWKASRAKYTQGKTVRTNVTYSNKYPPERRTVVINRYNNVYGGYAYADPYNHNLIWTFSLLWWANHWNTVDRSHYENDARMRELEKEVAVLRAKSDFKENPDYKDKNMNEAVMYSDGYLEGVKSGKVNEKSYKEDKEDEGFCFIGSLM